MMLPFVAASGLCAAGFWYDFKRSTPLEDGHSVGDKVDRAVSLHNSTRLNSMIGGQWNQLLNNFHYSTERPNPRHHHKGLSDAEMKDGDCDILGKVNQSYIDLHMELQKRHEVAMEQHYGSVVTKKGGGIPNAPVWEIEHPNTGERTQMLQHAFVPRFPDAYKMKRAKELADEHERSVRQARQVDPQYFQTAPGLPWRYERGFN